MTRVFRIVAAALGLLALSACENGRIADSPALNLALDYVGLGAKDNEETPPEIPTSTFPPLLVGLKAIRVSLPHAGTQGVVERYVAPDGVELALVNGFVTRAIGIGVNLEGMYLPADSPYLAADFPAAALAAGEAERVVEIWREQERVRQTFLCRFDPNDDGTIITETCRLYFDNFTFTNRYWLDADGAVTCSAQWFHPDASFLQFFSTVEQATSLDLAKQDC